MMRFLLKLVSKKYRTLKYKYLRKLNPILWPNDIHSYPFKMRRYPELSQQFLKDRLLREESNPRKLLSVDDYRPLIVDNNSEAVVKEVVDYYNKVLFRSRFCPTTVTIKDMDYIINNTTQSNRRRSQVDYLFIKEFDIWRHSLVGKYAKELNKEKENKLMSDFQTIGCFDEQNNLQYGFWRNTLFARHFHKSAKKYSFHNLRVATLFGQKLVIDCSYDQEMQEYEIQSVGRQMAKIYQSNRIESKEPFDLHFCSCDHNSRVMHTFKKYLNPIQDYEKHYVNIHTETYSQLFPNERLIYLSPDSRYIMEEYDPNAIYILGSLVGKTCREPLSLRKALDEGIECYRLPIHRYVELNPLVKKTLSFLSCFKILLYMKDHNDWELALTRGIQENKLKEEYRPQDRPKTKHEISINGEVIPISLSAKS